MMLLLGLPLKQSEWRRPLSQADPRLAPAVANWPKTIARPAYPSCRRRLRLRTTVDSQRWIRALTVHDVDQL
jgi:hypothetical protein